jgi:O-antigen/teichoic acid export membrane protein
MKLANVFTNIAKVRAARSVYVYFLAYFFTAALSVVTISLLTHFLTPEDYGIINLYSSFIPLLTPFVTCGVLYPIFVEYYKKSGEEYRNFFTNAQALTLLSVIFFTILFIVIRQKVASFLHVTPVWAVILPVTVWWIMNNELIMMVCRMKSKPWGFTFFSISKNLVEILLTISFVIGLGLAWQGRLLSASLAPVLLGIIAILLINRWHFFSGKIEWKQIGRIAWVSLPFVFERLSIFVLINSDRYFIDNYDLKGTEQVGLYSVGAQIATIIYLVILSMNSAYQPYLFQSLAAGNKGSTKKATGLYILAAAIIVAGIFLTTPFLFHLFINKRFHGGMIFTYYLSAGYFMWAVYNAFMAYLVFYAKNRLILYISVAGMLLSILLNFYMVPRYGAYGAAVTGIITYTFMAIVSLKFSWKYFKS